MINLNQKLLTAAILLMLVNCVSFSQDNGGKYGFIAIFKDTVLELSQSSEKELVLKIADNDIRKIISIDSVISLNSSKDTIWKFDITIDSRRCYGTIFSGPVLTKILKENYSGNIIFLYSSLNALDSRLMNGMLVYISEESNWKLVVKTE